MLAKHSRICVKKLILKKYFHKLIVLKVIFSGKFAWSLTVPKTDTGELIEKIKTNEITILKELGKFAPYVRKKEYLKVSRTRGSDCLPKSATFKAVYINALSAILSNQYKSKQACV